MMIINYILNALYSHTHPQYVHNFIHTYIYFKNIRVEIYFLNYYSWENMFKKKKKKNSMVET